MTSLLAQWNGRNNNNPGLANQEIGVLIVVGAVLLLMFTIGIAFLMTLHRTLARCRPENRTMEPAMVWLNLVPCLNIVWQFITVNRIADSLQNEFRDRGYRPGGDYGKGIGNTSCVLRLFGWIPYIGALFGLAGLICGIVYWVKIAGYSRQLASTEYAHDGDYYDDEDDDYDRPRRKKKRRRADDDDDRDDRDDDDYDRRHF